MKVTRTLLVPSAIKLPTGMLAIVPLLASLAIGVGGCTAEVTDEPIEQASTAYSCGGLCKSTVAVASGVVDAGMAIDKDFVYFNYATAAKSGLARMAKAGGPVEIIGGRAIHVIADGNCVFTYSADGIHRIRLAAGFQDTKIAPAAPRPFDSYPGRMAIDANYVYFTNPSAGTVSRVRKTGGAVQVLATGQTGVNGIAVDATNVYFAQPKAVRKMPIAGGRPTVLFDGNVQGDFFAQTDDRVWFMAPNFYGSGSGAFSAMSYVPKEGGQTRAAAGVHNTTSTRFFATSDRLFWTERFSQYTTLRSLSMGADHSARLRYYEDDWDYSMGSMVADATQVFFVAGRSLRRLPL